MESHLQSICLIIWSILLVCAISLGVQNVQRQKRSRIAPFPLSSKFTGGVWRVFRIPSCNQTDESQIGLKCWVHGQARVFSSSPFEDPFFNSEIIKRKVSTVTDDHIASFIFPDGKAEQNSRGTHHQLSTSSPEWINHTNFTRTESIPHNQDTAFGPLLWLGLSRHSYLCDEVLHSLHREESGGFFIYFLQRAESCYTLAGGKACLNKILIFDCLPKRFLLRGKGFLLRCCLNIRG